MKYLNDVSYKDCVGKVCKSLNSGDFKVLKYNGSKNVEVEFLNTRYRKVAEMKEVRNGGVKDPYLPSVYGVGVSGTKYPISVGGVLTKEYDLWCNMLRRCYSEKYQKKQPTYIGCEVSDNFKSFEYFYEWCHKQIGFNNKGWHLDKDLLTKGNKVYSEDSCVFIPAEINTLLIKCTASRGEYLIGVTFEKSRGRFISQISINSRNVKIGRFNTEIEAFNAYKTAKESFIKEQANKWKSQVDPRAYSALMSYEVSTDD